MVRKTPTKDQWCGIVIAEINLWKDKNGQSTSRIPQSGDQWLGKINDGKLLKQKNGAEIRFKKGTGREYQLSGIYLVKKIMETPKNDEQGYGNEFRDVGRNEMISSLK